MIDTSKILQEIVALEAKIKPMLSTLEALRKSEREADSRNFIESNSITRDEVELSSDAIKPWFGTVYEFGKWLKENGSKKVWAEWNGRIYHTSDLINGRMPDMPGNINHLP